MTPGGNVIGKGKCRECSAPVWLKKNANNRVYYFCDGTGQDANGMCNHHEKFGPIVSRNMINRLTPSNAATNQQETKVEHDNKTDGNGAADGGAKPAAEPAAEPERRKRRII